MSHRNRVTYQSESVFVGENDQTTPDLLTRVQSANYNFNITRTDVNQYGQVGRIDSLILEAPTVSLDLSYLLTDGQNEKFLDFVVENKTLGNDASDVPFYKNILLGPNNGAPKRTSSGGDAGGDPMSGKSYYILTVPDGKDAVSDSTPYNPNVDGNSLIKIGNGYINEWSMEVSVGSLPTVSCSFEAANIEVTNYTGTDFGALPAIDLVAFKRLTSYADGKVILPLKINEDNGYDAETQISALRPGDIAISLSSNSVPVDGLTVEWDSVNSYIVLSGDAKSAGTIEIRFEGTAVIDIDGDSNNQKTEKWFAVFEAAVAEDETITTIAQTITDALNGSPISTSTNIASASWNASALPLAMNNLDGTVTFTDNTVFLTGESVGIGADTFNTDVYAGNPIVNSGTQPGVIAKQLIGKPGAVVEGAAHIQSFNLSIPFGRTPLQRIGTLFSFARPLDLPTNATFSVNALVSELNDGKLMDKLCQKDLQIHIVMREPVCPDIDNPTEGSRVIEILLKDVELESESIGSSIGDNKTVDLTFNVGIHGAEDSARGIFVRFHDADPA